MLRRTKSTPLAVQRCFNPHPALRPDAAVWVNLSQSPNGPFQSSSGPSTGCCRLADGRLGAYSKFQSSSGPSTGCCPNTFTFDMLIEQVSILIRPFDRMLRALAVAALQRVDQFQSSSGPSTGCCPRSDGGPEPLVVRVSILIRPFDRMLRRHGAPRRAHRPVSILIRPFDRMLPRSPRNGHGRQHVSILIRPFDRMLQAL